MLKVKNLSVSLGGVEILKDISFCVNKGDYVCIVGENGGGKSTLIKAILGQTAISGGAVSFAENAGKIGYLSQQGVIQKEFPASCFEVVCSGCVNKLGARPFFSRAEKSLAKETMARLGVLNLGQRPFSVLSGGEAQRVLLARAICAAENLLILDEPLAGLDPLATEELYKIIKSLNEEKGMTVLMVSHDIASSVKYASKILHIGKEVRFFGTSEEYASSELGIHFTGRCCEHV